MVTRSEFAEFYERNFRDTVRRCRSVTRSMTEAEDLAQEIYTKMFVRWQEISITEPIGYLGETAKSMISNHFRSIRKSPQTLSLNSDPTILTGARIGSLKPGGLSLLILQEKFAKLRLEEQSMLLLREEGYSYKELSLIKQISVSNAKSRVFKARQKLNNVKNLGL